MPDLRKDNQQHEEGRPEPEELLRRYSLRDSDLGSPPSSTSATGKDSYPRRRGRLRAILGFAAGVGKTYAMLNEGHRRESRGTDIVVGYVETYGRPQTQAQLGDLEVIPRKKVTYRGVTLEEMDTEAIIARHPRVALIDDLAHTNVPGSKHTKRYQDMLGILDAGIDVVTTLNIQHLESLNDLVASITGVRVSETLPDWILDQAEEVELIDISPYALRQRMKHGNIYPPERIEAALNHFFREGNLTALRELALRQTAEKTESQLQQYMAEQGISGLRSASERVLVGFDAQRHSRTVIRDAWRLAHALHADLIAVSIEPEGHLTFTNTLIRLLKYGREEKQQWEATLRGLEEHVTLVKDLGAEVISIKSQDAARTLVKIAQERQVTQIVLGQPARRCRKGDLHDSVLNQLSGLKIEVDIHLVTYNSSNIEES